MTKLSLFLALLIACMAVTTINSQTTTKISTTGKPTTKISTTGKPTTKISTTIKPTTKTSTTRKPTTRSTTTRKPTTATKKPGPKYENPNLSFCHRKKDLFTADGKYVKSICLNLEAPNYEEARRRCAVNNMNLFIIDDEEVETLFYDGIMNLLPDSRDNFLWVNGKRQNFSNKWEINNPDGTVQGPLHSGLDFYSQRALGYCLSYNAQNTNEYRPLPANCNEGRRFACEHHKRTEDPPKLDTSPCKHKRDLYYNGKYLKSMCTVIENNNFDNARRRCANLGMNLFAFDSAITDQAFNEASEDFLREHAGGLFWINGKRDCHSDQWNILNANGTIRGPLYEGFEWLNIPGWCGRTFGNCLRFSGQFGPYQGLSLNCNDAIPIICEYKYNN